MIRRAALAVAAGVLAAVATAPARADDQAGATVDAEAWYWRSQLPSSSPAQAPSPDPGGHLMVALREGEWEKVALLRVRVSAGVETLALALDAPGDEPASDLNAAAAELEACIVSRRWEPVAGGPWDRLPELDCAGAAPGAITGDGPERRVTFDLSAMAARWAAGTPVHGVALVPAATATGTWQLALHGSAHGGVHLSSSSSSPAPATRRATPTAPARPVAPAPTASAAVPADFEVPAPAPAAPSTPVAAPPLRVRARGVPAVLAVDREAEVAAGWAAAVLVAAVAGATRTGAGTRGGRRLRRLAGAVWLGAAFAIWVTWLGVRAQGAVQWQVPYLASGGLAALVLTLIGVTLALASLVEDLPPGHPLLRARHAPRP